MKSPPKLLKFLLLPLIFLLSSQCGGGGGGGGDGGGGTSERLLYSFSQGSAGFFFNPPTLVGNYIYIGTSRDISYEVAIDNYFYKFNLDLTKVWEYPLGKKEVKGGATLDSAGNIYFVVQDREKSNFGYPFLYSLDNQGVFRWSKPISSFPTGGCMNNPAISVDDTIYIGGFDNFFAFDTNGNEKWTYGDNVINITNAPIIDPNGNIYFREQQAIISLDRNGTVRWTFKTLGGGVSSPAFSTDYSKVFVAIYQTLYCLETSTGNKVWEFTPSGMNGFFAATPAVDNNNNVYIGTREWRHGIFYAVKSDGSGLLWEREIVADLYSSPALGDDNTVYVGSEVAPDRLYALDMTTGNTKWESKLRVAYSSPAISNTGILYIASMDYLGLGGGVYAFRTDSTGLQPNAGSPRFHGSNSNTGRRV